MGSKGNDGAAEGRCEHGYAGGRCCWLCDCARFAKEERPSGLVTGKPPAARDEFQKQRHQLRVAVAALDAIERSKGAAPHLRAIAREAIREVMGLRS